MQERKFNSNEQVTVLEVNEDGTALCRFGDGNEYLVNVGLNTFIDIPNYTKRRGKNLLLILQEAVMGDGVVNVTSASVKLSVRLDKDDIIVIPNLHQVKQKAISLAVDVAA